MRKVLGSTLVWPAVALVALLVVNVVATPQFLEVRMQDGHLYGSLVDILRNGAPVLLVALGMTLVIATRGIDLSVGAIAAIAGAVACVRIAGSGDEPATTTAIAACSLALGVCLLLGLWNGFLVAVLGIQPIIATLILFISGRGIALVLTNGNLQTFTNPSFTWLGTGRALGIPVMGWIALALALVVAVVVRKTIYGRYLLSVGGNERAASLAGTPVAKVKIWTYVICSTLAGLSGLIVVAQNSASDAARIGNLMELDAIAAAVVGGAALSGGRAPILGTLLGALFIQLVGYTLVANGVPDEATFIVTAAIIVVAVWLQDSRRRT